jgi:hypothetical protein
MFVLVRAVIYAALFIGFVLATKEKQELRRKKLEVWCVFTFVFIGKGTPAPFDPPRKLVIRGPYRFVVKLIPRSTPNVFGVDAAHERFGIVFVVARLPPPQRYGAAGINAQTWAMLPKPPTLNYSSINDQLTLNHMLSAAAFSDRGWLKKC